MRGVFSLTALVLAAPAFAADRYVDNQGTDTGACTTAGSPCGTIAYALSQASAGDTVHVAEGSYSTGGLAFKGSITIEGAGSGTPKSLLAHGGGDVFNFESASGTVTIKGFAIQHSGGDAFEFFLADDTATVSLSDIDATLTGTGNNVGVNFGAEDGETLTLNVSNATFTDYYRGLSGAAEGGEVMNVSLSNTTVTGAGEDGLHLNASGHSTDATRQPDLSVHIDTSKFDSGGCAAQMTGGTLGGFDLELAGNTFSAANTSYDAVHVGFNDIRAEAVGVDIVGNSFKAKDYGRGLWLEASPATSFDATVVMNDNTFGAGTEAAGVYLHVIDIDQGSLTFSGNTLQDNGGNGATLYMVGNYDDESMLDLVCHGNTATSNGQDGIYMSMYDWGAAAMSVTGNTVEDNGDDGILLSFTGVGAESEIDVTVTGNTTKHNADDGLYLSMSDYGQGTVLIEDNTATANSGDQIYLYVENDSDAPGFLDLQVNNNTVDGTNGHNGIEVEVYAYNTVLGSVSGNTVTDAGDAGLAFWITDYTNLIDVTLSNNTLTGNDIGLDIGITDSTYNQVHFDVVGNTITNNDDDGVRIRNSYATTNNLIVGLRSNDISDNGGDGIEIDNSYGAFTGRFYGNLIRNNDENGIYVYSATDDGFFLKLTHNTISGNADGDYYDVDADGMDYYDVIAWENWWGTQDTGLIDDHIYDWNDPEGHPSGEVLYSALGPSLNFDLAAPSGPAPGGTQVLIKAADDLTRFVPSVPGHPLVVTFGGEPATDLSIANGGRWLWVTIPPHAPGGVIVNVINPGGQGGTRDFEYLTVFVDVDGDGVEDGVDNCLGLANPEQGDPDNDGMGNACDPDDDGDGEPDATDNCPLQANADQSDLDGDDIGDACDPDADGDEVADFEDNCLGIANAGQEDTDADDIGDACDNDANGDGVADIDQIAEEEEEGGCGCATTPAPVTGWLLVGLLGLIHRRRRDHRDD